MHNLTPNDPDDRELRELFVRLRNSDRAGAPDFESLLLPSGHRPAGTRPPVVALPWLRPVALAALLAILACLGGLVMQNGFSDSWMGKGGIPSENRAVSAADSALATPAADILTEADAELAATLANWVSGTDLLLGTKVASGSGSSSAPTDLLLDNIPSDLAADT